MRYQILIDHISVLRAIALCTGRDKYVQLSRR